MRAGHRRKHAPRRRHGPHDPSPPVDAPSETIEVVVLSLGEELARVRRLDTGAVGGLRAPDLRAIVPGLRVTVQCAVRRSKTAPKLLLGRILQARVDLDALALPHRPPFGFGPWPYDGELEHLPDDIVAHLRARPREMFEMWSPSEADEDLLFAAIEQSAAGRTLAAYEHLMRLVERSPGNIDAHLHLGNLVFDVLLPVARTHYEVAVQIGERQLGPGFDGVLSWGLHGNRAFLRSLHGLGLCQWRGGDFEAAEQSSRCILRLCPEDGIGARFLLAEVRAHKLWDDFADDADIPF